MVVLRCCVCASNQVFERDGSCWIGELERELEEIREMMAKY